MLKKMVSFFMRLKISCHSSVFTLFYTAFTLLAYNWVFWSKVIGAMDISTSQDVFFLLTYIFVIFSLFYIVLYILFVKYITKGLAIVLLLINAAVSYFISLYHIPFDKGMLMNVLKTDVNEVRDLLNIGMFVHFFIFGVLPALVILQVRVRYKKFWKEIFYKTGIILGIAFMGMVLTGFQYKRTATFVRSTSADFEYLVPSNYIRAVIKVIKHHFRDGRKWVPIGTDAVLQNDGIKKLVILVVGETARRYNFSLYDYERETNPLLKQDQVVALNNASSCGTATAVSLPCIFSHLPRKKFVNNYKRYEFLPSLLSRLGVNVLWRDNNSGGPQGVSYGVKTELSSKMNSKVLCPQGHCFDGILLNHLEEYIQQNNQGNLFIILHQNGSHGPRYNRRYPAQFEKFSPVCTQSDVSKCPKAALINAYDNTIVYTDYFLHHVIELAKKSKMPAVVLYASDHGESLGENNIYLHGFPYALAPAAQKSIPFIVWMSDKFKEYRKMHNQQLGRKKAYSHDNIFHSILGIFRVKTQLYDKNLDIFAEDLN